MPRFYVSFDAAKPFEPLVLPEESVHHAMRVLRLKQDDEAEVFNGRGLCAKGKIRFAKDYAEVIPETVTEEKRPLKLIVFQALVMNEKMDWIIEKACEMGYAKVVVFPAARSEVKLSGDRLQKRLERWNKIAVSACKQCGENFLPEIVFSASLKEAVHHAEGLKLTLSPSALSLSAESAVSAVTFAVGPEGGLSSEEIRLLSESGFVGKRLGTRILRTETAAIAAAAYAQTLWGDYN